MHRVRLAAKENRLTTTTITEADYIPAIEANGRGWVVEERGEVVGFAVGDKRDGNVWALFVHPDHEGHGHGRRLHDAMVSWLWAQGLDRLWLTTDPSTRAQAFYEAADWQRAGQAEHGELRFEQWAPTSGSSGRSPPRGGPPLNRSFGRPQEGMKIRLATPADLNAVLSIDLVAQAESTRRKLLEAAFRTGECWLAERAGTSLGFVILQYSFYGNGFVPLLVVEPTVRRQGVGRALLEHVASACATSKLFTSTNESNTAMRSLLAGARFEPSGIIHNLDPADPELVFFRLLRH